MRIFLLYLLLFLTFGAMQASAQDEPEPIKWKLFVENQATPLVKNSEFKAFLTAEIEKGWHLYALEKIEGGPIFTRITSFDDTVFELKKIEAPAPLEADDSAFGVVTKFYEDSARFTLPIRLLQDIPNDVRLKVKVRFQTCNDEMCLPPKTVVIESALKTSP